MQQCFSNPLRELHSQAGAEFQQWAEIEIVQTFGEPQAEYAGIHKSAVMIDLPQRGLLEVTGKDRLPFLQNLLTNQTWDKSKKTGLTAGEGVYAFLLNLQGRVVADLNVLERGDRTLIETDARFVEPLRLVFEQYRFAEQVTFTNKISQLHEIVVHGPRAEQMLGVAGLKVLGSTQATIEGVDAAIWRDDPTGSPGWHLILPTESAAKVWTALRDRYAHEIGLKRLLRPGGWAAFNATRIEAGRTMLAIDFDAAPISSAKPGKHENTAGAAPSGALPAETGLFDRAVSVTKGCYLGQEIVARMHARSQVARKVVGIRIEGNALPMAGAQILDEESNQIGVITSSTVSPILSNAPIALGTVKRPFFEVGTSLRVPAEGEVRNAVVAAVPFVGESK